MNLCFKYKDKDESYLHFCAKIVKAETLRKEFLKVVIEEKFFDNGKISFITDIACYDENGLKCVYEIYHTHSIDLTKIKKMLQYMKINNHSFEIYELQATRILKEIK